MQNKLHQIIYVSKATQAFTDLQVAEMANRFAMNNAKLELSGVLLYESGYFLQLLEGEKFNLYHAFKTIRDDDRHSQIEIISDGEIAERMFFKWNMRFVNSQKLNPSISEKIKHITAKNPKDRIETLGLLWSFIKTA